MARNQTKTKKDTKRLTLKKKLRIVKEAEKSNINDTAEKHDVKPETIRRWIRDQELMHETIKTRPNAKNINKRVLPPNNTDACDDVSTKKSIKQKRDKDEEKTQNIQKQDVNEGLTIGVCSKMSSKRKREDIVQQSNRQVKQKKINVNENLISYDKTIRKVLKRKGEAYMVHRPFKVPKRNTNKNCGFDVVPFEEIESGDWTEYKTFSWTIATHVQETGENAVDSAHFVYVHRVGDVLSRPEVSFDGPKRVSDLHLNLRPDLT